MSAESPLEDEYIARKNSTPERAKRLAQTTEYTAETWQKALNRSPLPYAQFMQLRQNTGFHYYDPNTLADMLVELKDYGWLVTDVMTTQEFEARKAETPSMETSVVIALLREQATNYRRWGPPTRFAFQQIADELEQQG